MSIEDAINEIEEKPFETVTCKVIDYPGNVNKLLDNLNYEQQVDWEFVNKLQVVYGKWGLSPLCIFYLEGDKEVEVWNNKNYYWHRENEARDQLLEVLDRIVRANEKEVVK